MHRCAAPRPYSTTIAFPNLTSMGSLYKRRQPTLSLHRLCLIQFYYNIHVLFCQFTFTTFSSHLDSSSFSKVPEVLQNSRIFRTYHSADIHSSGIYSGAVHILLPLLSSHHSNAQYIFANQQNTHFLPYPLKDISYSKSFPLSCPDYQSRLITILLRYAEQNMQEL